MTSPLSALSSTTAALQRQVITLRRIEIAEKQYPLTPNQADALQILAVTVAAAGFVPVIFAFYCFAKMKKAFHHFLILMFITGDSIKLIWYLIFPIIAYARGPVETSHDVCQAAGFFTAIGTEMSDVAILLIAVHNALYVFRPPKGLGEGGLYHYRYICLVLWIVLPMLDASLAFVNSGPAYVTFGTFCYLPKYSIWWRLGLTWIPRFTIILSIICIYFAIYIYVGIRFRSFTGLDRSTCETWDSSRPLRGPEEHPCGFRRVLQSAKGIILTMNGNRNAPLPPLASRGAVPDGISKSSTQRAEWEAVEFITTAPLIASESAGALEIPIPKRASRGMTRPSLGSVSVQRTVHRDVFHTQRALFRPAGDEAPSTLETTASRPISLLRHHNYTPDQLILTRLAIQRQLRFLFLYPVVYLIMWAPPFAANCLQWAGWYDHHNGFWLTCVVICFVYLQSTVDCLVFLWRERPWSMIEGSEERWFHTLSRKLHGISRKGNRDPGFERRELSRKPGEVNWWDALDKTGEYLGK